MGALRGRDIVCFSNDWDGDPLSKMHAMKILARENRVLWVNSIGNRRPTASARDMKRMAKKVRGAIEGIRERYPNIFVLTPLAIPFYGSELVRAANGALLRAQVKHAMEKLAFKDPISWSFLPSSAPVSGTIGEELVVYHCVDEFSAFSDAPAQQIRELERRLMAKADVVICSSEKLRKDKERVNQNAYLVQHGVDLEHFAKAFDAKTTVPDEVKNLPAGLPVVATAIPEVERLGLCRIGKDTDSTVREIAAAIAAGSGPSEVRAAQVRGEGWKARVAEMEEIVAAALAARKKAA